MRGDFNNSPDHLEGMGPSPLSTEAIAERIEEGLLHRTHRKWRAYLRTSPPCVGGIYIEPPPHRLDPNGHIDNVDWASLDAIFGAVRYKAKRWLLLPDEIRTALEVLRDGPLREKGQWRQEDRASPDAL